MLNVSIIAMRSSRNIIVHVINAHISHANYYMITE